MLQILYSLRAVTRARACTVGLQAPEQGLKVQRNLSQLCVKPILMVQEFLAHAM